MRKNDKKATKKNEAKKQKALKRKAQHREDTRVLSQNILASIDRAIPLLRERAAAFVRSDFNLYSHYGLSLTQDLVGKLQWFREAVAYGKDSVCGKIDRFWLNKFRFILEDLEAPIKDILIVQEPVFWLAQAVGCGIPVDDAEMKMDLVYLVWFNVAKLLEDAIAKWLKAFPVNPLKNDPDFLDRWNRIDDEADEVIDGFVFRNQNKFLDVFQKREYYFGSVGNRLCDGSYRNVLDKKHRAIIAEYGDWA